MQVMAALCSTVHRKHLCIGNITVHMHLCRCKLHCNSIPALLQAQGIYKAELRLPMQLVHNQLADLPWDGPPRNVTAVIHVNDEPTGHSFPGYIKKYWNRRKARLMLGYTDFMARYGGWCVAGVAMKGPSIVELHLKRPAGGNMSSDAAAIKHQGVKEEEWGGHEGGHVSHGELDDDDDCAVNGYDQNGLPQQADTEKARSKGLQHQNGDGNDNDEQQQQQQPRRSVRPSRRAGHRQAAQQQAQDHIAAAANGDYEAMDMTHDQHLNGQQHLNLHQQAANAVAAHSTRAGPRSMLPLTAANKGATPTTQAGDIMLDGKGIVSEVSDESHGAATAAGQQGPPRAKRQRVSGQVTAAAVAPAVMQARASGGWGLDLDGPMPSCRVDAHRQQYIQQQQQQLLHMQQNTWLEQHLDLAPRTRTSAPVAHNHDTDHYHQQRQQQQPPYVNGRSAAAVAAGGAVRGLQLGPVGSSLSSRQLRAQQRYMEPAADDDHPVVDLEAVRLHRQHSSTNPQHVLHHDMPCNNAMHRRDAQRHHGLLFGDTSAVPDHPSLQLSAGKRRQLTSAPQQLKGEVWDQYLQEMQHQQPRVLQLQEPAVFGGVNGSMPPASKRRKLHLAVLNDMQGTVRGSKTRQLPPGGLHVSNSQQYGCMDGAAGGGRVKTVKRTRARKSSSRQTSAAAGTSAAGSSSSCDESSVAGHGNTRGFNDTATPGADGEDDLLEELAVHALQQLSQAAPPQAGHSRLRTR